MCVYRRDNNECTDTFSAEFYKDDLYPVLNVLGTDQRFCCDRNDFTI